MHNGIKAISAKKLLEAAETRLAAQPDTAGPRNEASDDKRLLHELQVHQIELEMQNEELRQVIVERNTMEDLLGTYQDLYEFAPAGYFNLGRNGIIHAVNLTGAGFLGVAKSLLINNRLDAFISDETRPQFHDFLEKVFTGNAKETCEAVFVKKDHAPLSVQISALVSESGKDCRAVIIDISERVQAESLLREKDARLQFHLDNSPMAVIEWDSDFTVLNWTGESERLFGWSAAEAVGKPLTALQMVVEEDMPIVAATMARLTDGVTRQAVVTNRNYTKKGDIRHCTWYNSVLTNQGGRMRSVLSKVIDITERVALENNLLKARNELEERVRERTQALAATVESLRAETQQRLEAVEALRRQELVLIQQSRHAAMGEMIGNIAHQWRQPLNTLGLFTQRLGVFYGSAEFTKEFLDTSVAKSMEIIKYMSHTIDDFRSFFSTDREKTEFSIDDAVTKALSLVEAGFRERMIRVERGGTEDVRIYGFPNEYAQVLLNIFINARDAINERNVQSPLVKINIATLDGSSLLTISDNAGGIQEDTIDKIFDPYFSTKGPQYGTGIGLFMSKTIIEKNMGGRLTAYNTDVGAEFRIEV